ncbi:hypothetical protein [Polycladidibacter hongkongensis]|uniref:hypothetical protein n=1 Tax=Polycladidibacter hongkongensis TaxID=1647556 RepID=UPI0012E351B9|nr:hypothetical protein [Pseudovibrio hongkongensis]
MNQYSDMQEPNQWSVIVLAILGVVLLALLGGGLYLWLRYGQAVYVDVLLNGLAGCF